MNNPGKLIQNFLFPLVRVDYIHFSFLELPTLVLHCPSKHTSSAGLAETLKDSVQQGILSSRALLHVHLKLE